MSEPDRGVARSAGLIAGAAVFFLVLALWRPSTSIVESPVVAAAVAATALLMAIWWMTEALPIAATSLLPMVLLPLLAGEPLDLARVAANYANWRVFLFFGGFLIAIAMEAWDLHRRIALRIVRTIGTRPRRIVLGFMLASAFLSMWISNTATALMMLPIGIAVVGHFHGRRRFGVALMLGIAYGASVGGVATPIGTPPNVAFQGVYASLYPAAPAISFAAWMGFALPLVVLMLPIVWLVLVARLQSDVGDAAAVLDQELKAQGAMTAAQRRVGVIFVLTALLWVFREPIDVGIFRIPGWSALLPNAALNDGVVAMTMGLALFLVPAGRRASDDGARALLIWEDVQRRMPWDILLLFGGGFALADAIGGSGLSTWIGSQMGFLAGLPPVLLIAASATLLTFLTEITSNTATAQALLPLAAGLATGTVGMDPRIMMLPVTISASFAFMLPVATPPNAVVFGSGAVAMRDMVRHGILLNLIGILVVTLICRWLAPIVLGIDLGAGLPAWAG